MAILACIAAGVFAAFGLVRIFCKGVRAVVLCAVVFVCWGALGSFEAILQSACERGVPCILVSKEEWAWASSNKQTLEQAGNERLYLRHANGYGIYHSGPDSAALRKRLADAGK